MENQVGINHPRPLHLVGNDAADKVWGGVAQGAHQIIEGELQTNKFGNEHIQSTRGIPLNKSGQAYQLLNGLPTYLVDLRNSLELTSSSATPPLSWQRSKFKVRK